MAKVNFLNQDESFMSESYISQRRGNAHKKKQKMKLLYLGSNKRKSSEKERNKIEASFAEGK